MFAVAAFAFCSCSDEGYWEPYEIEGTRYSFAQANSSYSLSLLDSLTEAVVTVYRSTKHGNVTLPLDVAITDATVLSVADSVVTFVDGSDKAEIIVNVAMDAMAIGTKYSAQFAFVVDSVNYMPENASITGAQSHTMSIVLNYNWLPAGSGIFASSWSGTQFAVKFEEAEGYSDENGYKLYRIPNLYVSGYHVEFYLDAEGNAVALPLGSIPLGLTDSGAAVYYYNDYINYPNYCSFVNEGNYYVINALWRIGSQLYTGCTEQFLWQVGWPGATE